MFYRIGSGISLLVILFGFMSPVNSVRVNITSFKNCDIDPSENMEHFVRFSDISMECNADGLCDILHAKFHIPTINDRDKLLNITMWRCGPQTSGKCNENIEHFFEILPCERFHRDTTGPWAFLSDGMSLHSKCGANAGTFDMVNAQLKPTYLTNFMVHDVEFPRHRMRHMVRKLIDDTTENAVLRACIDMDFTVVFD